MRQRRWLTNTAWLILQMQGNFIIYLDIPSSTIRQRDRIVAELPQFSAARWPIWTRRSVFPSQLVGLAPGDIAVVYAQIAGCASQPTGRNFALRACAAKPMSAAHKNWLSDPIYRHCKEVTDVELHLELNTSCPVPGSYALEAIATVKLTGRRQKVFFDASLAQVRSSALSEHLKTMAGIRSLCCPAAAPQNQASVLVLRKRNTA